MARSLAAPAPRRIRPRSSPGPPKAGQRPAPFGRLGGTLRLLLRRRRSRIAVIVVALAVPLLAGGFLWVRHSPLVSVEHVRIAGVHGPDARVVDRALTRAARRMSTLALDVGALRAAVAPLHLVREIRASASFPHTVHINVIEQLPVAVLSAGGARTALAADGVALGTGLLSATLPSVSGAAVPAPGGRVRAGSLLAELAVLGAAPWQLAVHAQHVYSGPEGITVAMQGGLTVYFGDQQLAHAKWLALARVLAQPSSAEASYIDVRLPTHPAAGFPAGAVPESAASSSSASLGAGAESGAVAAIAAGLSGTGVAGTTGEAATNAAGAAGAASPEAAAGASGGAGSEAGTSTSEAGVSPSAQATGGTAGVPQAPSGTGAAPETGG